MANPLFRDPVLLEHEINAYFDRCEASRRELQLKSGDIKVRYTDPPSIAGLALHLGCCKDTLYTYINRESIDNSLVDKDIYTQVSELIARARDRIETITLSRAVCGDYDNKIAGVILSAFGYRQQTDDRQSTVTVKIQAANAADVDDWSR